MKILKYTLIYLLLHSANFSISQTYTQPAGNPTSNTAVTCAGTWVDNGGAGGNYSNSQSSSYCFYPSMAGRYVTITINSFDTQAGNDVLYIFDGTSGYILGSYSGTPAVPFSVTASTTTGELCCVFVSNGTTNRAGWSATISCSATPGTPPAFTNSPQDCMQGGGTTVCSDASFTGNSSGLGSVNDLPTAVNGCLGPEHQSSWYYFSPSANGTVEFLITPANGTDDYDFALYGPFTQLSCPWNTMAQPLRCSYAAGGGTTGLQTGSGDVSEGSGGDRYVNQISVIAGEVYVMVIDNFSTSSQPFTLDWTLSGGAALDCTTLPIELISFYGIPQSNGNLLKWTTQTETDNDFFTIERSPNGLEFTQIGTVDGAGTSNAIRNYELLDSNPLTGDNFYRLKQTDFNGIYSYSSILRMYNEASQGISIYPNPANDYLMIDIAGNEDEEISFEIFDAVGSLVYSKNITLVSDQANFNVSVADFSQGIYFAVFKNLKSSKVQNFKFVKE